MTPGSTLFATSPLPLLQFASAELPARSVELREQVRVFLDATRRAGMWQPRCDSWLTNHSVEFTRALAEHGWIGMTWPARYGGHERGALERYIVTEELVAAGAPVAAHWVADRQTGPTLLRWGTEQQRHRFLPAIARGECFFAIGMSEPDAGSDLASVRTRAEREDGGWRLSGTKVWTSQAHRSHHMLTLVRTASDGSDRHDGLSQMIVDLSAPGVDIRPIRVLSGEHHFNEVVLNDVYVPDEDVVGNVDNGWRQVMSELAFERSGPERFLSTLPLLAALVDALGAPPSPLGTVALGRLSAHLAAVRRLSLGVATALDRGEAPAVQAALVKDLGTRLEQEIVEACRLASPFHRGASADSFERFLIEGVLSAPGFTLRGGTSEILRTIVAREVGVR